MPSVPFTAPPVPAHLAEMPTAGGLVVPFTTPRHRSGLPALGYTDLLLTELCLSECRCGVCGKHMDGRMVFLMRPVDLARKLSNDPGLCPPCAAYTQRACPMVSGQMDHYRKSIHPAAFRRCGDELCPCRHWPEDRETRLLEGSSARIGAPADEWYALWTRQYQLGRDPEGRLAAGFAGLRVLALEKVPAITGPEAAR